MIPVFSILGDSISTFSGISIPEHMVFYDCLLYTSLPLIGNGTFQRNLRILLL